MKTQSGGGPVGRRRRRYCRCFDDLLERTRNPSQSIALEHTYELNPWTKYMDETGRSCRRMCLPGRYSRECEGLGKVKGMTTSRKRAAGMASPQTSSKDRRLHILTYMNPICLRRCLLASRHRFHCLPCSPVDGPFKHVVHHRRGAQDELVKGLPARGEAGRGGSDEIGQPMLLTRVRLATTPCTFTQSLQPTLWAYVTSVQEKAPRC
jgi:hypothetical protein